MAENTKLSPEKLNKDYKTLDLPQSPKPEMNLDDPESIPAVKKKKEPRRVIHCSDGVYEEYSTDEDEIEDKKRQEEEAQKRALIDPKTLPWFPWMVHVSWMAGSTFLHYCDSWGERLAWFFGITSPKYYWELEEFKKMKEEEEERKKREALNTHGWKNEENQDQEVVQQPVATLDASQLQEKAENSNCDENGFTSVEFQKE